MWVVTESGRASSSAWASKKLICHGARSSWSASACSLSWLRRCTRVRCKPSILGLTRFALRASASFKKGFGYLALRGDAAVEVQYKVAEADLVQAPQDSIDRGSLFRDEQNMLASGDQ